MAGASQRFFSFEIGRGDFEQLKKTFRLSIVIYVLIALIVLLLSETIGLWFVYNKLTIPLERVNAAGLLYQCAIISFLFAIMTMPYTALILAHEDMNVYAYISIIETVLKLIIVFLLRVILFDKLSLYGILLCIVSFSSMVINRIFCKIRYKECIFRFYWNRELFKEVTTYTGWYLFGVIVGVFKNQAINILLNQFFNSIMVAARGIASSITSAIAGFSYNFCAAIRPQIVKTYASGNKTEMIQIIFWGTKGTYFLMYIFTLPLMLEMPTVLLLWLKKPPEYTVLFTRLMMLDVLINSISYSVDTAALATDKIKTYQSICSSILLLNLPLSWVFLLIGTPVYFVQIIAIFLTIMVLIARILIVKKIIGFSFFNFLMYALIPICIVSVSSAVPVLVICHIMEQNIFRLFLVVGISIVSNSGSIYLFGLNKAERLKIKEIIKSKIIRRK